MRAQLERIRAALRSPWVAVAVLLVAGVASMGRQWGGGILWETDALFYEAKVLELRGTDRDTALRETFGGPLSERARGIEARFEDERRVRDPDWPIYSAQFYQRRLLLPAVAAAAWPVLDEHGLETVSLLAYVAIGPLLFLLLRRRLSPEASLGVSLVALALPPLRDWSVYPLTDSAGLALLLAGLLAALRVLERGPRRLPLWVASVAALAFTRDTAFLLVLAAAILALTHRERRSLALVASGVLAAAPAPLLMNVSLSEQLAYVLSDHVKPADTSWGFVLDEYLPNIGSVLERYGDYAASNPHVVALFLVGIAWALWLGPRGDPLFTLLYGLIPGYLLLLVVGPFYSTFRYELVLVPLVAAGLGLALERVAARAGVALPAPRSAEASGAT